MAEKKKTGGLAGVTAGQTALCTVGQEGAGLTYRGYDIYDLSDNARFEELLVAGRAELDQAKRNDIYVEMQSICRDEGGSVIPCFANNVDAASDKLGHPEKMGGNFELDGSRSISRWWFA